MTTKTLTAIFDTRAEADRAVAALQSEAGIPTSQISVIAQNAAPQEAAQGKGETGTGFWSSLKDMVMPDEDRQTYSEAIRRGAFLLSVQVDEAQADAAMDVLEAHEGIDLDQREKTWRTEGWTGPAAITTTRTTTGVVGTGVAGTGMAGVAESQAPMMPGTIAGNRDETISLAEERLRVGKREVAGGRVRVRSYVVETPVEESVSLHSERVLIDRRTVDRAPTEADEALFAERTIELNETAEEAVVSKTAHITEELVVRKEGEDRVETVRDTVRRTEVEVDDERTTGVLAKDGKPVTKPSVAPRR